MDTQPLFHLNGKTEDSWRAKGVLGFEYGDAQRCKSPDGGKRSLPEVRWIGRLGIADS